MACKLASYKTYFAKMVNPIKTLVQFSIVFQRSSDKEPRCVKKQLLQVFYEKGVLKNFAKFPGKHLCQIPFFNKVSGLRAAFLLKKRLWRRCFPVNFAEIFKKTFFTDYLQIVASVCLPSGNNLNVN